MAITIEEQEKMLDNAISKGFIKLFEPNEHIQKLIYSDFKNRYFKYFIISFIVCLVSVFILFIAFSSKIAIINTIFFFLIFSPIFIIVEYRKKKKMLKKKKYKCFFGVIQKVFEDKKYYRVYGINTDEGLTFLKNASPSNPIQVNDKVIIFSLLDDLYLLDFNLFYH